jgi:hypothetical protein
MKVFPEPSTLTYTVFTCVHVYILFTLIIYNYYIYTYIYIHVCMYIGVDVVEWSKALDVRLSEWCCSVSKVWVQIPSREEQKFDSSKI